MSAPVNLTADFLGKTSLANRKWGKMFTIPKEETSNKEYCTKKI